MLPGRLDHRRFPRIERVSTRQIVRFTAAETPQKSHVMTRDVSAAGVKFSTTEVLSPASFFLAWLNDEVARAAAGSNGACVRSGDYYLTRVVWTQKRDSGLYEVGARFVEKAECGLEHMELFTQLLNVCMMERLPLPGIGDS
jgi:hypothetical protein